MSGSETSDIEAEVEALQKSKAEISQNEVCLSPLFPYHLLFFFLSLTMILHTQDLLKSTTEDIDLQLQWPETLVITAEAPLEVTNANDDIKREMAL